MPKINLPIRKMDDEIRIENKMGLIAIANKFGVTFVEKHISPEELDRINAIVQDIEFHLANTIEE
jgi:hypothetical protein